MRCIRSTSIYWKEVSIFEPKGQAVLALRGDQNSRFFHKFALTRRRNNHVQRLKDETGMWREDAKGIPDPITNDFSILFKASAVGGGLTERERE